MLIANVDSDNPLRRGRFISRRQGIRVLLFVIILWVVVTFGLYSYSSAPYYLWYIADVLGIVSGFWVGYKYIKFVGRLSIRHDVMKMFGMLFVSFVVGIGIVLLTLPYYTIAMTFSFQPIHYSIADEGLADSLAAFATPLFLCVGFSVLYILYRLSRRYDVVVH